MTPREFFPLMPDEVFEAWIVPLIEANGWPFASDLDSTDVDRWPGYFLGRTLADWAEAGWTKQILHQSEILLTPDFVLLVMDLGTHAQYGFPVRLDIEQSASRVGTHREFFQRERRFPGFLTLLDTGGGIFDIADGSHRLAALWTLDMPGIQVPCWVATIR